MLVKGALALSLIQLLHFADPFVRNNREQSERTLIAKQSATYTWNISPRIQIFKM